MLGTAGWSFRFFGAIGQGCVPVWPTAHSIPPFASFLDYTYFTFFMRPIDIKILEQLLYSVPMSVSLHTLFRFSPSHFYSYFGKKELDEMQLALKIVTLIYNISSPDLNRWSATDLGLRQLYTLVRSQDKSTLWLAASLEPMNSNTPVAFRETRYTVALKLRGCDALLNTIRVSHQMAWILSMTTW